MRADCLDVVGPPATLGLFLVLGEDFPRCLNFVGVTVLCLRELDIGAVLDLLPRKIQGDEMEVKHFAYIFGCSSYYIGDFQILCH